MQAQDCSNNLLQNTGFENGFTQWNDLGSGEITSSTPQSGSKTLKICGAPTDDRVIQAVSATPGKEYTLHFWGKWDGGNGFYGGLGQIKFLSSTWQPSPPVSKYVTTANWGEYSLTALAPPDAAYIEISFDNVDSDHCAFFDEVCLTENGGGGIPCNFSVLIENVQCDLPNATFDLTATGSLPAGNTWIGWFPSDAAGNTQQFAGTMGITHEVEAYVGNDGAAALQIYDPQNLDCNEFFDVVCPTNNDQPDLRAFFQVAPPTVQVGGSVDIAFYVINTGNAVAGNSKVSYYLSLDQQLSSNDLLLGSKNTPSLVPNSTQDYTVTATIPANTAIGSYYLLLEADSDSQVDESNENNNVTHRALEISSNGGGGGDIDLSLSLEQSSNNPSQWSNYTVKATIQNSGGGAASGVKVHFPKPNGVVYTGGNEWTVSQGNFSGFGNEVWEVGNIPAGGAATLTVSYFLLENTAPVAYAQVTAANETDSDSTPNNGTPPTPNEDDEASTLDGGGNPPLLDLSPSNLQVPASAPPGSTFNFSCTVINIGNVVSEATSLVMLLGSTQLTDFVVDPIPAGQSEQINGTVDIPQNFPEGNYQLTARVDHLNTLTESNENNNAVSKALSVTSGSNNDLPDVQLNMSATPENPNIWNSFQVEVQVLNTGVGTATGVKVDIPMPSGLVYTGGNEWAATQGTFSPFSDEQWTVGTLGQGASATLTISYFLLTTNPLQIAAEVSDMNEQDVDSTPGNAASHSTPPEDDEAVITINDSAASQLVVKGITGRDVQLHAIYPNPVYFGEMKVEILSKEEGTHQLEIYDLFGRKAQLETVDLRKGRNEIRLNVSNLESGTYFLNMIGQNWRNMPVRFVVARW